MSGDERRAGGSADVDHVAAFAEIRQRLSSLDDSIDALRSEADRLTDSAASRITLAVLEPPAERGDDALPAFDEMAALTDSIEALGRHAANVPEDFDPRPYDPAADDAEPLDAGLHGLDPAVDADDAADDDLVAEPVTAGAFDDLAAAPAYEPEQAKIGASLPAFDAGDGPSTFEDRAPDAVLSHDPVAPAAEVEEAEDDDGPGATVLEFTPRSLLDPAADVPAFGDLGDDASVARPGDDSPAAAPATPVEEPTGESAFGPLPGVEPRKPKARSSRSRWASRDDDDGLDAIAQSESTAVPKDWDEADDDEAFDKFFSSEVEPEPAQRWLLNE